MRYTRTLVTGGTGFIGSCLVERLLEENRKVRVLALKTPFEPIEDENLKIIKGKGAEIVYGDLCNKQSLKSAVKGVESVFHLGAISHPMRIPIQRYYNVNKIGTRNILEAAKKERVKKFVHISTVSVLGPSPDGHSLKEEEFQEEIAHYGLSKMEGEKIALHFYKRYKFPVVVIRPCMVYGPRCLVRLIMFKYIQKGLFPLFNKGKARMEFCYVDNLVQALLLSEKSKEALGEAFNITDGHSYEIKKVSKKIAEELGVRPPFIELPIWAGKLAGHGMEIISKIIGIYPPFSSTAADWMSRSQTVYDCTKAKAILGYRPRVSLQEGVKRTVAWYKEKGCLK